MIDEWLARYRINSHTDLIQAKREIMQEIALAGLARGKFFEKATFYGGSALRIFHGLERYSEDLDFSQNYIDEGFTLEKYLPYIKEEFVLLGLDVELSIKEKHVDSSVESAFLKENTFWGTLYLSGDAIRATNLARLKIKIEIDRTPPLLFEREQLLLTRPYTFYVACMTLESLFAGKMHAVLFRDWKSRVKGRDWYDLEWYIKKGVPLNLPMLLDRAINSGHLPRKQRALSMEDFKKMLFDKIDHLNFERAKNDIMPFISNLHNLEIWSSQYFTDLASHLKYIV